MKNKLRPTDKIMVDNDRELIIALTDDYPYVFHIKIEYLFSKNDSAISGAKRYSSLISSYILD